MEAYCHKTKSAFLWTNLLNAPFWAMYGMLVFILYKDLHATPLQITLLIILKPVVSILSIYWSSSIRQRRERLLPNVILAGVIGHAPFFFFPFFDNPWFFVASGAFYLMLTRGVIPAWMEILKLNLPEVLRGKIFAVGSTISYTGAMILPFCIGSLLDDHVQIWRWLFPALALMSLGSLIFQARIPIPPSPPASQLKLSFKQQLTQPWKQAWQIMGRRPDFTKFQIGFMLGGGGLMIMQPALPVFFVDALQLSYMEMAIAISVCKGIGFALTSPIWTAWMKKMNLYRFSGYVTVLAALFPLVLILAQAHIFWLYAAYILYGVMQAGSELGWHLSGPMFAKDEDSSPYSSVNVLMVGLRGCVAPALGSLLCFFSPSSSVLLAGSLLCVAATLYLTRTAKVYNNRMEEVS